MLRFPHIEKPDLAFQTLFLVRMSVAFAAVQMFAARCRFRSAGTVGRPSLFPSTCIFDDAAYRARLFSPLFVLRVLSLSTTVAKGSVEEPSPFQDPNLHGNRTYCVFGHCRKSRCTTLDPGHTHKTANSTLILVPFPCCKLCSWVRVEDSKKISRLYSYLRVCTGFTQVIRWKIERETDT